MTGTTAVLLARWLAATGTRLAVLGALVIATAPSWAQFPTPVPLMIEAEPSRVPRAGEGGWREQVQLVWNSATSRLDRRRYEVFDPFADAGFDVFWEPRNIQSDRAGRIAGSGVLTWRRRGALRYQSENVVAQYRGDMADGRPHGRGIFIDRSGLRYDGDWANGLMEGNGHLQLPNGDVYRGEFKAGRLDGTGLYIDAAGRVYDGGFSAGLRHGPAQIVETDGRAYASVWNNGSEDPLRRAPAAEGWAKHYRVQMRGPADLSIPIGVALGTPQFSGFFGAPLAFGYAATSFADRLEIYPDAPRLLDIWRGRANIVITDASSFDWTRAEPDFREYSFLNYSSKYIKSVPIHFGLENRSPRDATIVAGYLDVTRSRVDMQPALQSIELKPRSAQNLSFSIENYGWSSARNARLTFRFQNKRSGLRTNPIQLSLGEVSAVHQLTFAPALAQFGVRLNELPGLGVTCQSASEPERGPACVARLVRSGVFGRLAEYVVTEEKRFGLEVVGQLDYEWTDADGRAQSTTAPFEAFIPIGTFVSLVECEGGELQEIDGGKPFQLADGRERYRIQFPLQQNVAAGTLRRWRIVLDADKSSRHEFRIVLVLADGQELVSRNISLLLFRPNSYAASIRPFEPRC